jgi:hypothetical protein
MSNPYHFAQQLQIGKNAERRLDALFGKWYAIETVPPEIERKKHFDRLFIRPDGTQISVEYKTDLMCHKTGNLVVEIVSVDTNGTPGWVYSSDAELLVWEVQGLDVVLVAHFADIHRQLEEWKLKYRTVKIPNDGYNTIGILVPIDVYRKLCVWEHSTKGA